MFLAKVPKGRWGKGLQNLYHRFTGSSLPRDLSVPNVNALLKTTTRSFDCAWLLLMLHSGLRTCEICCLKWKDLELDGHTLCIEQFIRNEKPGGLSQPTDN